MRGRRNTPKRLIWLAGNYRKQPEVFVRAASLVANLASPGTHSPNDLTAPQSRLIGDLAHMLTDEGHEYYDPDRIDESGGTPDREWLNEVRGKLTLKNYADVVLDSVRKGSYHEGENLDRSRYDRYVAWVGREVKRIIDARNQGTLKVPSGIQGRWERLEKSRADALARNPRLFLEEWDSDNYHPSAQHEEAARRFELLHTNLSTIVDWAAATRPNIMELSYNQAIRRANAWHRKLEKEERQKGVEAGEVVFRFPDGWTVQRLTTFPHLKQEGKAMHHCVGQVPHYWRGMERGEIGIYSLRDPEGKPRVTLEMDLMYGEVIVQAVAENNRKVPRKEADRIIFWLYAATISPRPGQPPEGSVSQTMRHLMSHRDLKSRSKPKIRAFEPPEDSVIPYLSEHYAWGLPLEGLT